MIAPRTATSVNLDPESVADGSAVATGFVSAITNTAVVRAGMLKVLFVKDALFVIASTEFF